MDFLSQFFPNTPEIIKMAWLIFFHYYGWVLFVVGFVVMFKFAYMEEIQHQFVHSLDQVFLQITVPRENMQSTLAVEQIFSQMHVIHRGLTTVERYVEGHVQMWYSLELVSMGGKISYIVRTPRPYQHLVESAFYSQYPNAEIHEIEDYLKNFEYNDPDNSDIEVFGVEFKTSDDSVIPIKTYKDFEHPTAEDKILDPLSNLFQTLERLEPWEMVSMQILIRPLQAEDWRGKAEKKIKELTGEEVPHESTFTGLLMKPFDAFAHLSFKDLILGGGHHGHEDQRPQKNNWMSMTESEKEKVTLIEKKLAKPAYQTKIRLFYVVPKDKYDKIRRIELIGAFRHLTSGYHNGLKTDGKIWTKVDPKFSGVLEKPYLDRQTKKRKLWFVRGFKNRSMHVGSTAFLLNIEELATLYHFPITKEGTLVPGGVQSVGSKKVPAPSNLPVATDF